MRASRSEVLRWESEIASVRRAVIRANARRNQSEIEVNRLLHRPLEEKFETEPEGISQDSDLKTTFFRIRKYVGNPWNFSTFRDFMAKEGLAASPDLRKLDAAIAVQQRILVSARRAFWAPVLALTGEGTARARGGAGSDFALADLFPGLDGFPKAGNFDWTLAFNVQFPLFTSGEKEAEVNRAREELARLRFERDAVAEGIEQRIRSALHGTGSSYASIELADAAMKAAQQNLELVTDAYQEGVPPSSI